MFLLCRDVRVPQREKAGQTKIEDLIEKTVRLDWTVRMINELQSPSVRRSFFKVGKQASNHAPASLFDLPVPFLHPPPFLSIGKTFGDKIQKSNNRK